MIYLPRYDSTVQSDEGILTFSFEIPKCSRLFVFSSDSIFFSHVFPSFRMYGSASLRTFCSVLFYSDVFRVSNCSVSMFIFRVQDSSFLALYCISFIFFFLSVHFTLQRQQNKTRLIIVIFEMIKNDLKTLMIEINCILFSGVWNYNKFTNGISI